MTKEKKEVWEKIEAIDEEYSSLKNSLSKKQDKTLQNIIAQKRVDDYSILGRGMNFADKATSVAVRGNTDIVIESPSEKEMYITLGQKMLDSETRNKKEEGGDIDAQMETLMPTHTMPDGTEMPGATHEEYEQTMSTDEDMEDGYLDFILDEALEDEEETYLMEQLESNDRLSLIFDKVVDVATEFAGSGPVEGPGSGVSDSIPARLSDGEFVITAKATEEIGVDNLEAMMKEAEAQADERQELNLGGKPIREEEMEVDQFGKPIDSNVVDDEIRKGMLSTNPRLK